MYTVKAFVDGNSECSQEAQTILVLSSFQSCINALPAVLSADSRSALLSVRRLGGGLWVVMQRMFVILARVRHRSRSQAAEPHHHHRRCGVLSVTELTPDNEQRSVTLLMLSRNPESFNRIRRGHMKTSEHGRSPDPLAAVTLKVR